MMPNDRKNKRKKKLWRMSIQDILIFSKCIVCSVPLNKAHYIFTLIVDTVDLIK